MKKNKYCYLWVIQGFFGYGWEDVSEYDKSEYSYLDVRHDLQEYRISSNHAYRIIKRRELNEE